MIFCYIFFYKQNRFIYTHNVIVWIITDLLSTKSTNVLQNPDLPLQDVTNRSSHNKSDVVEQIIVPPGRDTLLNTIKQMKVMDFEKESDGTNQLRMVW